MASDVEAPLVGRTAHLQRLTSALVDVGQGQTAAVFLTGESGVGKSRLLREAATRMRTAGATVLAGSCLDIGDASPLHALLQALRRFDAEQATDARCATAVRDLLRLLRGGPDDADGAGALLERVSRGLHLLAGGRPLVLILDDLQWVDRSTRQLLLYLLAGLGDIRLSVLAAVRAESLQGTHPLRRVLTELRRLRSVQVVDLGPLDRAETEELAAAVVGRALEPDAVELVWQRSGGNPFAIEELARAARDGRVGLSDTLREVFLARVDALPAPAHAVVHAVAAGVEPVAHWLLARVVAVDEPALIHAIRAAVAHRLLVGDDDGYRLRHRLVAEVLEHELLPAQRAALHRRYAEALSAVPGELQYARLAHHWRLAGDEGQALTAALAAAREAERLHGFAEAHRHFSTAIELADTPAGRAAGIERAELWQHAAEAAHHSGEHARALALLAELAASDEPPRMCWLHIRRARYLAAAGRAATAEEEYERALAAPDCTPEEKATAAAHLAELLLHLGRYADAGWRARVALELAGGVEESTSEMVRASAALGFSEAYREDPETGLTVMRQALAIAERSGRPDDVACAYLHLAELLIGPLNQLEEGVLVARRGAERVAQLGLGRTYETRLLAIAAKGQFRVGQWAEAERVIAAALRHRPSGADAAELLIARSQLHVGYGDVAGAERDLEAATTLLAGGGARHILPLLTLKAGLAMWQGRFVEARHAVQRGLTETRSDDLFLLAVLAWHGLRAEAMAHVARTVPVDPAAVHRLREVVARVEKGCATAAGPVRDTVEGYLGLCHGEVSRIGDQRDPEVWGRAAQVWDRRNHPYPAAYARLREAEVRFAARRRNAAATTLLRAAAEIARRLGAKPLGEEIAALATRARVTLDDEQPGQPARAAQPGGSGDVLATLTAREREVLAAVAEGLTNREIGERLFISERTIGVHVSHIFDKLQVRSRVAASRIYLRREPAGAS